jgi:hypothetical protein
MSNLAVNSAVAVVALAALVTAGYARNAYFGAVGVFCPAGQRPDVCLQIYRPACGWFDPESIQCIRYPCAATYSNSCVACADEKVLYWTDGPCPE